MSDGGGRGGDIGTTIVALRRMILPPTHHPLLGPPTAMTMTTSVLEKGTTLGIAGETSRDDIVVVIVIVVAAAVVRNPDITRRRHHLEGTNMVTEGVTARVLDLVLQDDLFDDIIIHG
mmetsp:Transcript_36844/g.88870  ORF Transcript_36844/g.88870 Transcript_36844/m.88870 type:complete len:118 (-) Transcript_36844:235-588(-)